MSTEKIVTCDGDLSIQIVGYVARGNSEDGAPVFVVATEDQEGCGLELDATNERHLATKFVSVGEAAGALWNTKGVLGGRIIAIGSDGSETALPTYEEAIAHLAALAAQS